MKINWKQKLSSRKFWCALIGWITSILAAFNVADSTTTQITLIASGIGALAVYMLAESIADAGNKGKSEMVGLKTVKVENKKENQNE